MHMYAVLMLVDLERAECVTFLHQNLLFIWQIMARRITGTKEKKHTKVK